MGQHDSFVAMSNVVHSQITATTSSAPVPTNAAALRKFIRIQNFSGETVFVKVGGTATINDWPIEQGSQENFGVDQNTIINVITAIGTADIRIMEYS